MAIMILIFYDYDNPYDCDDYNYIDNHYDDNEGGKRPVIPQDANGDAVCDDGCDHSNCDDGKCDHGNCDDGNCDDDNCDDDDCDAKVILNGVGERTNRFYEGTSQVAILTKDDDLIW